MVGIEPETEGIGCAPQIIRNLLVVINFFDGSLRFCFGYLKPKDPVSEEFLHRYERVYARRRLRVSLLNAFMNECFKDNNYKIHRVELIDLQKIIKIIPTKSFKMKNARGFFQAVVFQALAQHALTTSDILSSNISRFLFFADSKPI